MFMRSAKPLPATKAGKGGSFIGRGLGRVLCRRGDGGDRERGVGGDLDWLVAWHGGGADDGSEGDDVGFKAAITKKLIQLHLLLLACLLPGSIGEG